IMKEKEMWTRIDGGRRLVMERDFNLSREKLYQLFKKPTYLKRWWSTDGFELTVCDIDFQPNGEWHFCMQCMDKNKPEYGIKSWSKAIFTEINEPEKIVYEDYFSDETGHIDKSLPTAKVTFEFIDLGEKTKLISYTDFPSADEL